MPKQEQFKPRSKDEVLEETSKMQAKINKGGAKSYDEAEKLVEIDKGGEEVLKDDSKMQEKLKGLEKEINEYKYVAKEYKNEGNYGREFTICRDRNSILSMVDEYKYLDSLVYAYREKHYYNLADAISSSTISMIKNVEREIEEFIKKYNFSLRVLTSTEKGSGDYRERITPVENIKEAIVVAGNRESNRVGDYDPAYLLAVDNTEDNPNRVGNYGLGYSLNDGERTAMWQGKEIFELPTYLFRKI